MKTEVFKMDKQEKVLREIVVKFEGVEKTMDKILKKLSPVRNTPLYSVFFNYKLATIRFIRGLKKELKVE